VKVIVLGFDPGGRNRNAVAILRTDDNVQSVASSNVESAEEAIDWFSNRCASDDPEALGIDTLLHWSLARSGWRPVDELLRSAYQDQAHSVLPMNSIYGSMLGQGMALALGMRKRWPDLKLNEVHPKVVHYDIFGSPYFRPDTLEVETRRHECLNNAGLKKIEGDLLSEDQFDAILCCLATLKGLSCDWVDLLEMSDRRRLVFPVSGVSYLWPKEL
jgi:predicted nuclease with RNAse H fold